MKRNDSPILSAAKEIKWSFTFASIVYLVLGLVLLLAPNSSSRFLCTLIGVVVSAYGVFNILSYVFDKGSSAYTLELLIGICAAAFGIFSLFNPDFILKFLFIVLGLVIMVSSIAGIKRALNLHAFGFSQWWLALISACLTLIIALSIVLFPKLYGNMALMVLGIILIVESVSDLLSIHRLTNLSKKISYTIDD